MTYMTIREEQTEKAIVSGVQLELLPFSITPEVGLTGPRLWVRRLVILKDPSNCSDPDNVIRDISLKPGLNIIWSPDQSTKAEPWAHGSGKTLFCRLVRYCVGENNLLVKKQLKKVRKKLPNSAVCAEVMVKGELWIVIRNLRDCEHDIVTPALSLDDVLRAYGPPTGMKPLTDAITRAILGDSPKLMPDFLGESGAWSAALAWATRDPKRFDYPFKWRAANSESGSPVRGMSLDDHILVVRALIGALMMEEVEGQRECKQLSTQVEKEKIEINRLTWEIRKIYEKLSVDLGQLPTAKLPADARTLIDAAEAQLAKARKVPADSSATTPAAASKEREEAQNEFRRLEKELTEVSVRIDLQEKNLARMRVALPEVDASLTIDRNAVCPACKIPLEEALTKGCLLSNEAYSHSWKSDFDKRNNDIREEAAALQDLLAMKPGLEEQVDSAERRVQSLNEAVARFDNNKKSVKDKELLLREADKLRELFKERANLEQSVKDAAWPLKNVRSDVADCRIKHAIIADRINHLSSLFHNLLNELFTGNPRGAVRLDGKRLVVTMTLDVELDTDSVDAMKVIAFDMAALALSIEGGAHLPGFLIHDSPKSTDVGNLIYGGIFELARKLESFGDSPLFQYIVTTTSKPPDSFCDDARWITLKLYSAPAERRLLKINL